MEYSKPKKYTFLIIITIGLGYIVWNSPLAVDDLYYQAFGFKKVSEIFHFAITYGNGRLLGNMLIHFILGSRSFRTVFQTLVILLLWLLSCKAVQKGTWDNFQLGIILFLAISPAIFREDYLWSSAFANYIPGVICMFLAFRIVNAGGGIVWNAVLLIVSIAGQLFVEHTSLINMVFSLVILAFFAKTKVKKEKIMSASVWFAGTVVGLGLMFSIPKLFYVANEWENYQKVNIDSFHNLWVSVISNGMQISGIYLQNVVALVFLSFFLIMAAKPKTVAKLVLALSPVYGFVVSYVVNDAWTGTWCGFLNLLMLVLYLGVVLLSITRSKELKAKNESLFYLAMCVFSVLPLLVVYPIGARCVLHSYVFLVMAILSLFNNNPDLLGEGRNKRISAFAVIGACILVGGLAVHFHTVGEIDQMRLEYTQSRVEEGANKILVPKISSAYVKENDGWSYGQVFYQKEKQDIEFEFIPDSEWKDTADVQG